jgi:hypothetical protein
MNNWIDHAINTVVSLWYSPPGYLLVLGSEILSELTSWMDAIISAEVS